MRWRISLAVVLLAFVAVSCDQQPVEPATDQVAETPTFNFMNGPENPGKSGVERLYWEDCWWCGTIDGNGVYLAAHYQGDDMWFCGGSSYWHPWETQLVVNSNGEHYNNQAYDVPLFIYSWLDFQSACSISQEACCEYRAEGWMYRGTHDMVALDNWQENRWYQQMNAHGIVYDHDGNEYMYRERQKLTSEHGWTHEEIVIK